MADLRDEATIKGAQKSEHKDRRKRGNNKNGKKPTSYKCPHKGHSAEYCWADHPDKRPQWKIDSDAREAKEAKDSKESKRSKDEESNITEHFSIQKPPQ